MTGTIKAHHDLMSTSSEDFVRRDQIDAQKIWAHTVVRIKAHLQTCAQLATTFGTDAAQVDQSFEFLKFLNKNMTGEEPLHAKHIIKAREHCNQKVKGRQTFLKFKMITKILVELGWNVKDQLEARRDVDSQAAGDQASSRPAGEYDDASDASSIAANVIYGE